MYQKNRPRQLSVSEFEIADNRLDNVMANQSEINFLKTIEEIEEVAKEIASSLKNSEKVICNSLRNCRESKVMMQDFFVKSFIMALPL